MPKGSKGSREAHPAGQAGSRLSGAWRSRGRQIFVVQKHAARRLHYDFRLEVDGVLKSWAVPKGPSLDPAQKRLAIEVEDHPLEYADFEGVIAEGQYGAGAVIVWDTGPYRNLTRDAQGRPRPMAEALRQGLVEVWLEGHKLKGGFALVRTRLGGGKRQWLLVKMKDEYADSRIDLLASAPESVLSGRTVEEVAEQER
jgi:DNA ligase D-like protein (predicted 3'-phosphoesterase)